jgi:integrase/recombinase XerD
MDYEGLNIYNYCHKRLLNYCRLKGYSKTNTYGVYKSMLEKILHKFPDPEAAKLTQIQDFAATHKNDNTRRNICIMIRWLFNSVYSMDIKWYELPYPKKTKKVQPVYDQDDILKVLSLIRNEKQKAILALIIDCGLRISEPCSILLADCSSKKGSITLRAAKADNDRVIYPSPDVWELIKVYWNKWADEVPKIYLFEGQIKGKPYSPSAIRETIKRYCGYAKVKYLGVHAIRRFTITWSIENDVPISVMAQKVGHSSTRTIEKHYAIHSPTYLKGIKTPLSKK